MKTTVMRILDSKKIKYESYEFEYKEDFTALNVAQELKEDPNKVFKTLIVVSEHSKKHYACMVPANKELNLKKAAKSLNEKSLDMIPLKELLPLTGYIHGGCSPIGLKKQFDVLIDISACKYDKIIFSGGKRGVQVELTLQDLEKVIKFKLDDIAD